MRKIIAGLAAIYGRREGGGPEGGPEAAAPDDDALEAAEVRVGRDLVVLAAEVPVELAEEERAVLAVVGPGVVGRGGGREEHDEVRAVRRPEALEAHDVPAIGVA